MTKPVRILYFKSQISAYTTKRGVFVPAHTDKRTTRSLQSGKDERTPDMFVRPPVAVPKRDMPADALERPEDFTPDLFSGKAKSGSSAIKVGDRVRVDASQVRASFLPDRSGQPSGDSVRHAQMFEDIMSRTKNRPHVSDTGNGFVEIASGGIDADERVITLKIPAKSVSAGSNTRIDADGAETPVPMAVRSKKYYVTMIRDPGKNQRVARLAGPFDTHEEALSHVDAAKEHAYEVDPKSAFDAFGTSGVESDNHKPGVLNEHLEIGKRSKLVALKIDPAREVVIKMSEAMLALIDAKEDGDARHISDASALMREAFGTEESTPMLKMSASKLRDLYDLVGRNSYQEARKPAKQIAKSTATRILFLKSHVKQYTRKDGTVVEEHDDKRMKQMQSAPAARPDAKQPPQEPTARDAEDVRGSSHGYGTHNIEEGDTIHFKAGEFSGGGKVKAIGKDGAQVEDASGRMHNVHWHEVTGFKADRGDGGGKKPPDENGKPVAEGEEPPKKDEPKKPVILGKQEPIPAESFNAADYAKSHDQADVSPESIIAEFPADTKEKIAAAQDRLKNIEETLDKFMTDGKWTPERQELHRKILYDGVMGKDENGKDIKIPGLLSPERIKAACPPQGEQPAFIILGGRGGSGKSSFKGEVYEPDRCIVLDADHIKSMLPEYEGWNAHQVHEESGELFDHVADFARIMGLNVVLDKTMKTAKSAIADVEKFKKSGYRTEAHYMHLPRQEAGKRAVQRFLDGGESGRYVPPEIVLKNTTNEDSFNQVKDKVDAWSFRDNNVPKGAKPILISQSGEPVMKRKEILRKSLERRIILAWRIGK